MKKFLDLRIKEARLIGTNYKKDLIKECIVFYKFLKD